MQETIDWLKNYFAKSASLPAGVEELNYFEIGLIDSLGVIELIENIESHFNIQFTEMNFQERRFSTIKGLAEIIKDIKKE